VSTLEGRTSTALLVIDVQNGVVAGSPNRDEVVGNINALVGRARSSGTPVVWVQHSDDGLQQGTAEWEYVPELVREDAEPLVHKHHGDSFEGTDLEQLLADRGVGHVVVAGAQSDACIRSTIHGAFTRGYDVTLVGDAHTTEDLTAYGAPEVEKVISHTNLYWSWQSAPGRSAAVKGTPEVDFTLRGDDQA